MPKQLGNPVKNYFFLALSLLVLLAMVSAVARTRARPQWQQKVDDWVLQGTVNGEGVEFLVVLEEQAVLAPIDGQAAKADKGTAVYKLLTAVALRTQPQVITELVEACADYRPYWISNMIWSRGDQTLVESLARRPDVAQIVANPAVKLDLVTMPSLENPMTGNATVDWNIELVGAPDVWAEGVDGTGVVVGAQDTGYAWQHPALKEP